MQAVSGLLTVLMIIVTSEAAENQYCKQAKENFEQLMLKVNSLIQEQKAKENVDQLMLKVNSLIQEQNDAKAKIATLTCKVEAGMQTNEAKENFDQLMLKVNTLIQEQNDAKAKIATLTSKVEAGMQTNGLDNSKWVKLNSAAVCFGAKDSQFGSFNVSTGGNLMKLKLVHLYGYVSCLAGVDSYWSHWGCGYISIDGSKEYVGVSITDAANTILFPPSEITQNSEKWTLVSGYNSRTPELVMSIYANPVVVTAGQVLRLWYTQDLVNGPEGDNGGRVCADIYGYFM